MYVRDIEYDERGKQRTQSGFKFIKIIVTERDEQLHGCHQTVMNYICIYVSVVQRVINKVKVKMKGERGLGRCFKLDLPFSHLPESLFKTSLSFRVRQGEIEQLSPPPYIIQHNATKRKRERTKETPFCVPNFGHYT